MPDDTRRNADAKRQATVTLAAALIAARGAGDVKSAMDALEDAKNLLRPAPSKSSYKEWLLRHGIAPADAAPDEAAHAQNGAAPAPV